MSALIDAAKAELNEHYAELYGIEELSDQLGVTKHHLVRAFHKEVGIPPGQYLIQIRINAVKDLLIHRDYSLEVIATLCGFSGANYLCKTFKKVTGQTPASYRTENSAIKRLEHTEAEHILYV